MGHLCFDLLPSTFPLDSLVVAFSRELAHLETSPLELLGFVATLLNVWLMARNKVVGWPVGLVAVAAYSVVNFDVELYADMLLQGFFFVTGVAGWYDWKYGGEQRTELPISRLSRRGWALTAVAVVATSVLLGGPFHLFTNAANPFLDSALAGASVVGQLLLVRRVLDNWLIWIVADMLYVPLFISRGLLLTALLYAFLVVLATKGYLDWKKEMTL